MDLCTLINPSSRRSSSSAEECSSVGWGGLMPLLEELGWHLASIDLGGFPDDHALARLIASLISPTPAKRKPIHLAVGTGKVDVDLARLSRRLLAGERVLLLSDALPLQIADFVHALTGDVETTRLYLARPDQQAGLVVFRIDADGISPLLPLCPLPSRARLSRDFASLLAARHLMRRANGPQDDYGRLSARRWIAGQSVAVAKDVTIADPEPYLRIFSPDQICGDPILYLHGGGLVHYDLDVFTPFLSHLSAGRGAEILAVGYDKCPETPAAEVIDTLMARVGNLSHRYGVRRIMGDSIGGLLALYAALRVLPGQFGQAVLLYPVLSLRATFASYERYGEGHLLDERDMRWFRSLVSPYFLARNFDPVALSSAEFGDLDVTVASAGCDVLADEARLFVETCPARLISFPDLPHDFCLYHGKVPSAGAAVSELIHVFKQERNTQ